MPKTSIHDACRRGDIDAVRALIAADPATVDADDEHGWRPIFHAGLWRHEQVVRLLIEAGADLAAHDGYVMHYAGEVPNSRLSNPKFELTRLAMGSLKSCWLHCSLSIVPRCLAPAAVQLKASSFPW
jgi:ankyrin repeat protein